MANETEVIRDQMEATRSELSNKLEKLENKVMGSVQDATSAVAETVQNATATVNEAVQSAKEVVASVKETVEGTMESVKGTVDAVKGVAENAAEGVKDTFTGAAETVKQTFRGAADGVRDACDLPMQVDRHPWLMVGGAVAVGFVAGKLLDYGPEALDVVRTTAESGGRLAQSAASAAGATASAASTAAGTAASWMAVLEKMFGPEFNKVKELAIGALGSVIREAAVQAAPEPMAQHVREIIDGFTSRLGGTPVQGSVLGPRPSQEEVHNGLGRRF